MIDLHFITALIYLFATLSAWMAERTPVSAEAEAMVSQATPSMAMRVAKPLLIAGLVVHAIALFVSLFGAPGAGINIGFSHAVSLIIWLTLLSYVALGHDARLTRLAALYLVPVAIVASIMTLILPAHRIMNDASWSFRLHLVVAILAYALFTVAALHALLMMFLEKRLHDAVMVTVDGGLPPLLRIEKLLFQLLTYAFILHTATLITGVFFSEAVFGKAFQINHKTVFAVVSWFIFGGLLLTHWFAGLRGRIAARWTLIGFVMLLLSYVGSKFVLEIILKRF
jgi:ABC-type uncharacterized transport system permease subunit